MDKKIPNTPLISRKDMEERAKKTKQRIHDVGISCGFIKEAFTEFERLEQEKAKEAHWQHHLRCDGLPRPYIPPEMRTFVAEMQHYQQFDYDHSVDWTLSVDERSILTQDIFHVDKTRGTRKIGGDDHIGDRFKDDISKFLEILVNIECMLDNQSEMSHINSSLQMEIMKVRQEIEEEIDASFDRLTYRIIRMDGVYMDSVDAIVAKWGHKCEQYAIDIWGLRDVSIRFEQLMAPMMIAELVNVGATVQMPESVLHDCLTLRCIHTMFDTYSQYAKSFDPIILEHGRDISAGIIDIEEALAFEWDMHLEIQDEIRKAIVARRAEYDEIMRIIVERTEKAAREKKGGDESKSLPIPKAPKEPIKLAPDMLPDVTNVFLEREQQDYLDMLDEMYNPLNMKLQLNEINLRQYVILGGIYSIVFLRRPPDTNFWNFNIILNTDKRKLYKMSDIVAGGNEERDTMLRNRTSSMTGRAKLKIDNENKKRKTPVQLEDNDLPYFHVTLQLTQDLCLWGEPVVCQYITEIQDIISDVSVIDERAESTIRKKQRTKSMKKSIFRATLLLPQREKIEQLSQSRPLSNVFRPTLISILRHSKFPPPNEIVVPVKNFSLLKQLNHLEIRRLERYCVPRLISSFKLPQEVREELQMDQKPKQRNLLMRRRSADVEEVIDYSYIDFNFDDQHAPERMFPVFTGIEHVIYDEDDINAEKVPNPKSMYGMLNTFNDIRLLYGTQHSRIMNQSEYGVKKTKKMITATPLPQEISKRKSTRLSSSSQRESVPQGAEDGTQVPEDDTHVPEDDGHTENVDDLPTRVKTENVEKKPKTMVTHWTTKYILETSFDRAKRTISIKTDRLGIFGLAFKRYEHFPFRDWCLEPNEENSNEIILRLDTFHARVMLYISAEGVRGYVTDLSKGYVAKPIKYLEIPTPIADFRILRRRFLDKSINIFAEHDASYYIDNGYFSVKHVATEDHIYDAMALHCKLMKFYRSSWNRLASRRNVLICMKNARDSSDFTEVTVLVTPDTATFVEVSELCSDDLDIIKLDYKHTWRNMSSYTDLHQTIVSMNPGANDVRNKDTLLLFQIKRLLREIHILSYS